MDVISAATLEDELRLEEPHFYLDDPFPVFARLQRESPVHLYEPLNTWVVSTHQGIRTVGKNPLIFSNRSGQQINDFRHDSGVVAKFFASGAESFGLVDPPRQR